MPVPIYELGKCLHKGIKKDGVCTVCLEIPHEDGNGCSMCQGPAEWAGWRFHRELNGRRYFQCRYCGLEFSTPSQQ